MSDELRSDARVIWQAAVDAARPEPLVRRALADRADVLRAAPRILLLGAGKAGAAPAEGVTLADKLAVTKLLHHCGATINELNAVRKHLSAIKGGRLAEAFTGKAIYSLIISDVIGDPLDVIASGPTAADPSTFAEALAVLDRYALGDKAPPGVVAHLERGAAGGVPETPKRLPPRVHNVILGNNALALR